MSETQVLLGRIVSLRQRLEQSHEQARKTAASAAGALAVGPARVGALQRVASEGAEHARLLDTVRPAGAPQGPGCDVPAVLTARARRCLERGRDLFQAVRDLADDPEVQDGAGIASALHREATGLTDAALRMLQALPDSPGAQLLQCEGVEAVLAAAAGRLATLGDLLRRQREESGRVAVLADFLARLDAGTAADLAPVAALAESLLEDAAECAPLRFLDPPVSAATDRDWVIHSVACRGLTVAQVVARLVRHETELRQKAADAVLAALLQDAGMVRVSPSLLAHPGPLDDAGRRAVEAHCRAGAEMLAAALPDALWLAEAAAQHHERADGTGYPAGLRDAQTSALARFLAVCDVYAAACCRRSHRPARQTRTALTDALLMAEQGALDGHFAERLLQLSFYPVGSAVELADGSVGVVVAAPGGRRDPGAPARPVVALVIDAHNHYLPAPRHLDLAQAERHSIVRTLTPAERRRLFGTRYPEWA